MTTSETQDTPGPNPLCRYVGHDTTARIESCGARMLAPPGPVAVLTDDGPLLGPDGQPIILAGPDTDDETPMLLPVPQQMADLDPGEPTWTVGVDPDPHDQSHRWVCHCQTSGTEPSYDEALAAYNWHRGACTTCGRFLDDPDHDCVSPSDVDPPDRDR